jgi:hypothetical protein
MVRAVDRIERRGVVLLWAIAVYGLATVAFGLSRGVLAHVRLPRVDGRRRRREHGAAQHHPNRVNHTVSRLSTTRACSIKARP